MLTPATPTDFPTLFRLLEESFPIDEYRPRDAQLALLSDPRYTLWTNADRTALISVWQFPDFAFVEHFAVSPAQRNNGLGASILQEALSSLHSPVCLEAELPESPLARRRLNFYERNGFFVNPFPYLQPAYAPDRNPVPMQILSTAPLTPQQFQQIRDTLYQYVYKM